MDEFFEVIGTIVVVLFIVAVFAIILAFPTMWIVNYVFLETALMAIFGTTSIGFWKALCLNLFFGIAFKSSTPSSKK
ncbi:MAG: hypothetical protein QMD50_03505 [Patescibacteria group bacterium]|nr:hypothetical protein [Patescibacteria group bacterium]